MVAMKCSSRTDPNRFPRHSFLSSLNLAPITIHNQDHHVPDCKDGDYM